MNGRELAGTLGVTLFSMTPNWRRGESLDSLLTQVAEHDCGPAIELIGYQAWRGFPRISDDDTRHFRALVDRLGLVPAALGVYTDLFRRPRAPMTQNEAFEDIQPQLEAAARLGFPAVRATLGMEPYLLRRVAAEADRLAVTLTFEVQGNVGPQDPAVLDVVSAQQEMDTPFVGLTLDFSLSTPALPAALQSALARLEIATDVIDEIVARWSEPGTAAQRITRCTDAVRGHTREDDAVRLLTAVLGRCGRQDPIDWSDLLPLARHAHAKFWDTDVSTVSDSNRAWLAALDRADYDGAIVSEWGGHELLLESEADPVPVSAAHLGLLRSLQADLVRTANA
jgi:hypothetical protein